MSIPAAAPARLQELLQINGRLTAERDALLAAAGTLDESRSKVAELQAVAQVAECARDEAAQRLAAILRESEVAQRKLDDARSEAVARAAEAETHVAARDMARTELLELGCGGGRDAGAINDRFRIGVIRRQRHRRAR
jgi:hypothetical protein